MTRPLGLRAVFMGTPDFALPSLRAMVNAGCEVVGVITQPDKPAGRGHKLTPPPVKSLAMELGLPVYQFARLSDGGAETLRGLAPDVCVTVAYGQILRQEILDIPRYGVINVHASLLPRLRGAAPINWAVINGDTKTGVTTMRTVLALDAGDILERDEFCIPDSMTAGELYGELKELGARTLLRTLEKLRAGTLRPVAQDEGAATFCGRFGKGFGAIDFRRPCREIYNFVRGTNPFPGSYFTLEGEKFTVYAVACEAMAHGRTPGEVLCATPKEGLVIAAAGGAVRVLELKKAGKKRMATADFLRGNAVRAGAKVEDPV